MTPVAVLLGSRRKDVTGDMVTAHHQSVLATTPFKFIRPGGLAAASTMNHSAKPVRSSGPTNASSAAPIPRNVPRVVVAIRFSIVSRGE
jgi:hypothetical protein